MLKKLKVMRENEESNLRKEVMDIMIEDSEGYSDDVEGFCSDLLQHGCVSGMIGELVYYADTLKFFEEHKSEINELLSELSNDTGLSVEELFGKKWDNDDPLCIEQSNKNLMAWFGFEETVRHIYNELCGDDDYEE